MLIRSIFLLSAIRSNLGRKEFLLNGLFLQWLILATNEDSISGETLQGKLFHM